MSESMKWDEMTAEQKNVLIAQKVFGHKITAYGSILKDDQVYPTPDYSTDIREAWKIVEKLGEKLFDIRLYREEGLLAKYCVNIWVRDGGRIAGSGDSNVSMPDAVCMAALRAMGVEIDG